MNRAAENRRMLGKLAVVALAMFGFGFALVPLYDKICEATGINNLLRPDAAPANTQVDTGRWLTVEFDTNLHNDLPWTFTALERSVRIRPGALTQVTFEIRNHSNRAVTGQAIPSYGPRQAARHFKKLDCFCFTQQTLAPGEVKRMPVAFVIDRELPQDVNTVTLSYTFFEVEGKASRG